MNRVALALLISGHAVLTAGSAGAQTLTFLQNDDYAGGAFTCDQSLQDLDSLAARFTALPGDYPYTIDRIQVLVCSSTVGLFAVEIWQDDAGTVNPGPVLWTSTAFWQLDPETGFLEIVLSTETPPPPPITSGTVRVALTNLQTKGFGFGFDSDITSHRNFVYRSDTFDWQYAENVGFTGDWVMRLGILPAGSSDLVFADGFESEDTSAWSVTVP